MAAYFDSTAVLSFLLQQPEGPEAARLWIETGPKVSSLLLQAECLINLRRHSAHVPGTMGKAWLADRVSALSECMADVTLKDFDASILEMMAHEDGLAECRTLDAIHLATALFFRNQGEADIVLVSLDARMRRTAEKLNLKVLPKAQAA